jgi:NDP-sugar pyrophosphorylase family protein
MIKNKTAIILAGGIGERLRPYTLILPKPLMPLGDKPIAEILIKKLAKEGFQKIILAVNYRADLIKSFFENGRKWNVKIIYSFEKKQLGTAGPLKIVKDLPNNFLVINGDILSDINLDFFFKNHLKSKKLLSISITSRKELVDYGVVLTNKKKQVINFKEKPVNNYLVSMGVYCLNKKVLNFFPQNKKFGFNQLILFLLKNNFEINTFYHNKYWLDIGRPNDYEKAQKDYEKLNFIKK